MRIRVAHPDRLGEAAADEVVAALERGLSERGRATLALSGGKTPVALFAALARRPLPWATIDVLQVDERVAPVGHPERNLTAQEAAFRDLPVRIHPMPVLGEPSAAVEVYAAVLAACAGDPPVLDCVHLGLGDDGHTASLVPGDTVLDEARTVACTAPYQGRARLTLTFPVLNAARRVVWLVSGASKREMAARMLAGDPTIPAGRVTAPGVLVCDPLADPTGQAP